MKKLFLAIVFFYTTTLFAQQNLVVEGITPNLYLTHIVAAKENFFSIGRLYNQAPNSIATFNQTKLEKGLAVGQTLKIPLNTLNYDVSGSAANDEVLIPVYHVVSKNETLFRIGNNHSTPLESIRQWNKLTADKIEVGNTLMVGHLRAKKEQAAAFKSAVERQKATAPTSTKAETQQLDKTVDSAEKSSATTKVFVPESSSSTEVKIPAPEVSKENVTPAKEKPVEITPQGVASKEVAPNKTLPPVAEENKKEVVSQKDEAVSVAKPVTEKITTEASVPSIVSAEEGAFGSLYSTDVAEKSLVNKAGEAGTFKSTSGWQDKKYYVLMNEVTPGTIVKLSASTNKVVYAKVLGAMPDTKDSGSLLLRMSNAAASNLGIIDPRFPVQVTFYQ